MKCTYRSSVVIGGHWWSMVVIGGSRFLRLNAGSVDATLLHSSVYSLNKQHVCTTVTTDTGRHRQTDSQIDRQIDSSSHMVRLPLLQRCNLIRAVDASRRRLNQVLTELSCISAHIDHRVLSGVTPSVYVHLRHRSSPPTWLQSQRPASIGLGESSDAHHFRPSSRPL